MELHSNAHIPDGLLATMTLLSEKPRQGVPSRESALNQGIGERNCTAHLGLRFRSSETASDLVDAPNNGPTTSHCIGQSLRNGNGTSLALDAAGFIPGEKLLGATAGVVTMVGIGVTSTVNSAMNGDLTGSLSGIAGTQLAAIAPAAKYAGISLAESIPGIGTLLNVGVTARDAYHTYQAYQGCMAGH
jgi:hypothetical protein